MGYLSGLALGGSKTRLYCIYLYAEAIMREALDNFEGTIIIWGRTMNNLRYADDVFLLLGLCQSFKS